VHSDGSACAILCSEEFVRKHGLQQKAVEIVGMAMSTDLPSSFETSCIKMVLLLNRSYVQLQLIDDV
jgi:sterol carrier protein 2